MAKQTIVTVDGKEYKLQHPGVRWYMQNSDSCKNRDGILMSEQYADNMLKFVVVEPKGLTVDSFEDDITGLEKLLRKIEFFLRGKQDKSQEKGQE